MNTWKQRRSTPLIFASASVQPRRERRSGGNYRENWVQPCLGEVRAGSSGSLLSSLGSAPPRAELAGVRRPSARASGAAAAFHPASLFPVTPFLIQRLRGGRAFPPVILTGGISETW